MNIIYLVFLIISFAR